MKKISASCCWRNVKYKKKWNEWIKITNWIQHIKYVIENQKSFFLLSCLLSEVWDKSKFNLKILIKMFNDYCAATIAHQSLLAHIDFCDT